jgi:DNA invertase Pin-like site-specific DNA recombinase
MFKKKIVNDSELSESMKSLKIDKKRKIDKNDTIIYVRCSSLMQTLNEHQSLQNQIGQCVDYCMNNNLNVINIIQEVHPGHDITKLKVYSIPDIVSNYNIVMVEPSRLCRNVSHTIDFITKCNSKNIKLHFTRDNIVSDSHHDIKQIISQTYDAHIETETLSKRLKSTFEMKKRHGSTLGRIPFGFEPYHELTSENIKIRRLKRNEKEQDTTTIINMMYFGCADMNDFNNLFIKLTGNTEYKLTDSKGNIFKEIYYRNFTKGTIIHFLNENNILNRNKKWTVTSVDVILNKSEDFPVNLI